MSRNVNPILPAPSADPWMIFHEGFYYFCESRREAAIHVRRSRTILDIGHDDGARVWTAPKAGPNRSGVWAPELHWLDGKWHIYYAADNGRNENHRMWVLESETSDARGAYRCRGMIETGRWAIDGTVLALNGGRYFVWSGWPGKVDGEQNLYIAPMKNARTLAGEARLIARPDQAWERQTMPICEGPQVLQRNGKSFLVYSASASWTEDYCLGLLELTGGDPLQASSWTKVGPVFQKNELLWGVGHCSFVKSPCGAEDWMLYHAKSERTNGWADRQVYAQRFSWRRDGLPDFGAPLGGVAERSIAA